MAIQSAFGQRTRQRVLDEYFQTTGAVTATNAWEHVYRTMLWMDERTHLAHIYDSNHMQRGGNFYARAVRFTELLCQRFGVSRAELGDQVDYLFRGCVQEMLEHENISAEAGASAAAQLAEQEETEAAGVDLDESAFLADIIGLLQDAGFSPERASVLGREIDQRAKTFFTLGNKRQNVLGEGFEDLLTLLLQRIANVPAERIRVRTNVADLPGFRKAAPVPGLRGRTERLPKPDIAIVDEAHTYAIVTAKRSMRQDREMQFAREYSAYSRMKVQNQDIEFFLVTNEFDVARLDNVARSQPGNVGGYLFHTIYHVNAELLRETQGNQVGSVGGWIQAGKIASLEDFFRHMATSYGSGPATDPLPSRRSRRRQNSSEQRI